MSSSPTKETTPASNPRSSRRFSVGRILKRQSSTPELGQRQRLDAINTDLPSVPPVPAVPASACLSPEEIDTPLPGSAAPAPPFLSPKSIPLNSSQRPKSSSGASSLPARSTRPPNPNRQTVSTMGGMGGAPSFRTLTTVPSQMSGKSGRTKRSSWWSTAPTYAEDWDSLHVYRSDDRYSYNSVIKGADKETTLYYVDYEMGKGSQSWANNIKLADKDGMIVAKMMQNEKGSPTEIKLMSDEQEVTTTKMDKEGSIKKVHTFNGVGEAEEQDFKWKVTGFGNLKCHKISTGETVAHYRCVMAVTKYGEIRIDPEYEHLRDLIVASAIARHEKSGGKKGGAKNMVDFAWFLKGLSAHTGGSVTSPTTPGAAPSASAIQMAAGGQRGMMPIIT